MTVLDDRPDLDGRPDLDAGLRAAAWEALGTVLDPELDEPITDLGFVTSCAVADGAVAVRLRLPTAFCSPSFAYLMAADAADALRALPGAGAVSVVLEDHHDSAVINAGVAAGLGFAEAYPREAAAELHELRALFRRKAHQAYVERVCSNVVATGWTVEDLGRLTLADLPAGRLRDGLLRRRGDLGLALDPACPVCVDEQGVPWPEAQLEKRLRFARAVRVSIDGNAHFCRGLLATRYPGAESAQAQRSHELLSLTPVPSTPTRAARSAR